MTPTAELRRLLAEAEASKLFTALSYQKQVDEDGTLVGVSRQALEEALILLSTAGRELPALLDRIERLEAALKPLADIPLEEFLKRQPDDPIMGWNNHYLRVRHVYEARAALNPTADGSEPCT